MAFSDWLTRIPFCPPIKFKRRIDRVCKYSEDSSSGERERTSSSFASSMSRKSWRPSLDEGDDDDFQDPVVCSISNSLPLRPSSVANTSYKKAKIHPTCAGKENSESPFTICHQIDDTGSIKTEVNPIPLISSYHKETGAANQSLEVKESDEIDLGGSISPEIGVEKSSESISEYEGGTQLKELIDLCWEKEEEGFSDWGILIGEEGSGNSVECPVCGIDITGLREESRFEHTNLCLDREEQSKVKNSLSLSFSLLGARRLFIYSIGKNWL